MCGIAGFVALSGAGRSSSASKVLQSIEHRGPDDAGWLSLSNGTVDRDRTWRQPSREPEVLLLHRRLSILDISQLGWQPMSTADGRYHIVFNGEIYNYRELRTELADLGCKFSSESDTEVLLAAYALWGKSALKRLIGMFAFALLDVELGTVLLVRDFFGIKPLYFSVAEGFLCFGSEIKALLAFGIDNLQANPERLLYFLRYGMTDFGSETMFSAIRQLPPAHYLEIDVATATASEMHCYWRPEIDEPLEISFAEAASELRELFLRSIELHLRSDVPLGSALSGGIDSSAIVMAIRHLNPKAEIHAFSFISDDPGTSEEQWIDLVGQSSRAEVHKVRITSSEFLNDLDLLMHFQDEPFARTSTHAQYEVFRAARLAGVKVMLDGQGADEILAGYRIYQGARLASTLRAGEWSKAAGLLRGISKLEGFGMVAALAFSADFLLPPSIQGPIRRLAGKEAFPAWINREWFAERGADIQYSSYTTAHCVLKQSLFRSVREGLPPLLRYEDRNSMASSVESRVPFLTPQLVNFVGRLPESYLVSEDGTSKAVFRQAMRGIVPDPVLDRKDKMGFVTPEIRWLTELDVWVRGVLDSEVARNLPFLNLDAAKVEWELIRDRKKPFDFRIWRWVSLIRWVQEFGITFY